MTKRKLGSKTPPKIAPKYIVPKGPRKAGKPFVPMNLKPSIVKALIELAALEDRSRTNIVERLIRASAIAAGIVIDETIDYEKEETTPAT